MTIIAFSGKGGTGKTTLAALSVKYFTEKNEVTLAFDMDPDAHLYKLLGLPLAKTIGNVVDHIHKEKKLELEPKKPVEVSDIEYFYSRVMSDVLVEGEKTDLLTLGKPSSDIDCYCPVFYWAEQAVSRILKSYKMPYAHIVIDCDPGTEIFPRKILDRITDESGIDYIFTVLDGSRMSLDTAHDIAKEINKKHSKFGKIYGICNRVDDSKSQQLIKEVAKTQYDLDVIGFIPTDQEVVRRSLVNESMVDIASSSAFKSIEEALESLHV
ncbi:MAG: AAA family ATPase [Candidatus Bathyarchaeota archaeon]|jgi:CO dehydrogenase maturation factor